MTIPPFPSHDLAKLVLGYLAEEQLMTAYDEFLQSSPYLDALKNEYDRIFMTSLKNILAEYRAVKIYVETCKPIALRRKLFGCANLLEVVKFLVQHIDVNKIYTPDTAAIRFSSEKGNNSNLTKSHVCEVCSSLNLAACTCRGRQINTSVQSTTHVEDPVSDNSIEATSLEDLPGNHIPVRKKHVKVLEKEKVPSSFSSSEQSPKLHADGASVTSLQPQLSKSIGKSPQMKSSQDNTVIFRQNNLPVNSAINSSDSKQKIEEFNEILSVVCNKSNIIEKKCNTNPDSNSAGSNRLSVDTYKDFAAGVSDGETNAIVPDSSTLENSNTQALVTKDFSVTDTRQDINSNDKDVTEVTKAHIMLKVKNASVSKLHSEVVTVDKPNHKSSFKCAGILKPKTNEQKITILSDIKVDKTLNKPESNIKMPDVIKNATSTPLMQMQTIVINGTPAYKQEHRAFQKTHIGNMCSYTKDEIMAMPTIILVPSSSSGSDSVDAQPKKSHNINTISKTARCLGPLIIDVASNSPALCTNTNTETIKSAISQDDASENNMLIKTVEVKNSTMPKDGVGEICNKNTPHSLPVIRKSSSTPRRTSHVRVLDFTTPRRILQETINEHGPNQNLNSPVEGIISKSPNLHTFVDTANSGTLDSDCSVVTDARIEHSGCAKENTHVNKIVPMKRCNWDADLRALAIANDTDEALVKIKPKPRSSKRKKSEGVKVEDKNISKKKSNSVCKKRNTKNKLITDETTEETLVMVEETVTIPVKPTINIIPAHDWENASQVNDKVQNKSNNEDLTDTPELDRLSLQNAIGAKLNISDLLETPYKQALYDIQMETPRFLGPDLPDDPMSDIKIMNIPTPRFLNTPKPAQPTPSSYSSRPTDYSSGGSYYKPDDQDYTPDLRYLGTSPKEKPKPSEPPEIDKDKNLKPSRPIRKCTKNVSYFNSPNLQNKSKELDDKIDMPSSCSETSRMNNSLDNKIDKVLSKTPRESKSKVKTKTGIKKKDTSIKKRKSPAKRDTSKTFMKIKPRRPTPLKETAKSKRKSADLQGRKKADYKEKSIITPAVVSAPTKSRRKSSTPRKLHCTKTVNSESSGHESPDMTAKNKQMLIRDSGLSCAQDSDTEQLPLRWSDDGSQDAKSTEPRMNPSVNDSDDITKIQEFIEKSESCKSTSDDNQSNLHVDLVKRGFDIETAKIIERDLLDTPPYVNDLEVKRNKMEEMDKIEIPLKTAIESDHDILNNKHIEEEDEDEDDIELSVHECNEDTNNYITCQRDDTKDMPKTSLEKLKDKFSMEVCIDDGMLIRLRATPFSVLLEQDPSDINDYNCKETEMAVSSISNIERLYTPLKDSLKAQCYEIFDSTLTSLDTPLKPSSPRRKEHEITVTNIVLEVEKIEERERVDVKEKVENKKRKRLQSENVSDDSSNENKRPKPETQYLLNSTNIQNIDIESVLSKLHGP